MFLFWSFALIKLPPRGKGSKLEQKRQEWALQSLDSFLAPTAAPDGQPHGWGRV